ncbi:MAG: N-acetylmuramoyl-L-alanine amidase, partial [Acidimicrobiaceae bacterium]|nr:N-acetylmuramoyl-L-alanine amidase [Acidimicrobiaceae bacterium]
MTVVVVAVVAAVLTAGCSGSARPSLAVAPATTTTTTSAPAASSTAPVTAPLTGPLPAAITTADGVTLRVTGRAAGGAYAVAMPCDDAAAAHGSPTPQPTVVLDPGHGGDEDGAMAPNGLAEKSVNLAVAEVAKDALEQAGVPTVLTRAGDYGMTLTARTQLTLALRPRAFVSIHHNALPDGPSSKPGTETYYQVAAPDSKRLAG